jgi:PAS domain S-box-containing protein
MATEKKDPISNENSSIKEITGASKVPFEPTEFNILILCIIICFSIFFFDTSLKIGFAVSILYIIPAVFCIWSPKRRTLFIVAGISSALALIAIPLKPSGDYLIPLFNRPTSLLALWTMTLLTDRFIFGLKKLERGAQASKRTLADIIDFLPDATFVINLDGRVIAWNKAIEKMSGVSKEDMMGQGDHAFSIPFYGIRRSMLLDLLILDDEDIKKKYDYVTRTGNTLYAETFCNALDGGKGIYIWATSTSIFDDKGNRAGAIESIRDITEKKKTEQAIEKERARLQLILDSLPVAVAVADETGSLQIVNKKTHEIWAGSLPAVENIDQYNRYSGYHPGSDVLLQPEDWPISRALRTGETIFHEEIDIQRLNNTRGTVLASAMPMKDEKGKIYGALVAYMDITEMKETEKNLARSNLDLQQFAYVASHDLQEPLRMVTNYISLLERRYQDKLDPMAREYIRYAVDGAARMRELIDDLLEYSRVDRIGKEFTLVDMNIATASALEILKAPAEETKAEIVVDALPTIFADESQMEQLMLNLVANAIKFHGPERPKIHISASQGAREWTFAIKDNGIGLNIAYSDKIFQMFQRLHSKKEYPGTGIGLAVAKKIVERHSGKIWVESAEGKGATFFFTVPILTG